MYLKQDPSICWTQNFNWICLLYRNVGFINYLLVLPAQKMNFISYFYSILLLQKDRLIHIPRGVNRLHYNWKEKNVPSMNINYKDIDISHWFQLFKFTVREAEKQKSNFYYIFIEIIIWKPTCYWWILTRLLWRKHFASAFKTVSLFFQLPFFRYAGETNFLGKEFIRNMSKSVIYFYIQINLNINNLGFKI